MASGKLELLAGQARTSPRLIAYRLRAFSTAAVPLPPVTFEESTRVVNRYEPGRG